MHDPRAPKEQLDKRVDLVVSSSSGLFWWNRKMDDRTRKFKECGVEFLTSESHVTA